MTRFAKKISKAFFMSFGMFCAIPVPFQEWDEKSADLIMIFFPVVGIVIGVIWYFFAVLLGLASIPLVIRAAIVMLLPFFLTGFLHLDGFMDTSDALLSRRPAQEKLRILKDSHVGSFAVISLASVFVLWFAAAFALLQNGSHLLVLAFIPAISRAASSLSLLSLPTLPQSSYGEFFKKNTTFVHKIILTFILLAIITAMVLTTGIPGAVVAAAELVVFAVAMTVAVRGLGGISGDLCGYALIAAETAAILTAATIK